MTKNASFRLLRAARNSMRTGLGFGRISNNLRLGIVALLVCVMLSALLVTMRSSAASPPACTFSDDLEPAQEPGWTFEVAQNNIPTSPTWALAVDAGAHSATHSFTSDATANDIKDDRLISPPLNLAATSTLSFWHKFAFEDGFDGGLLEVSVDGGAWSEIAPAAFTSGAYNGTIGTGFDSPITGRNAWTGTSSPFPTMDNVVVNLSAFAGSNVRIRWRLGLDNGVLVPGAGWWIDDITITDACPGATPSPTPSPSASPSPSTSPTPTGVDLSIVATAANGTVRANETYIDVIRVKNSAATNATNVQIQVVLAPGAVYLGTPTTPDPASGTGTAADPLIWNLGTLNAGAETRIYLYQRAKTEVEDHTIVWQLLDSKASVTYTLSGNSDKRQDQTLGPKVVPVGDVGETVRHGLRPFPVAYVEYTDMKHTRPDSIFLGFFDSLIARYLEMSMNQLLPEPSMPSLGRTVTFASTSAERYRFSTAQPAGFCGGATLAEDTDPYDDDTPPPVMTNRIENGWYQLPGTRGYYGSDSTVSAYPAFVAPVGLLLNIDNGCGPPGKIAYDAATLMDPDVDYNEFDTDRDGWVDFFELVYQGQPENILGQTGADNVWPHSSGLQYYYKDGYTSHDRLRDHQDRLLYWTDDTHTTTTLTDTGKPAYVRVGAYNVNAEFSDAVTFAHEYGHSLGLPDEYTPAGRNTIDDWSLMSSSSGHMGIWDKQELGWIVPFVLTSPRVVTDQAEIKKDINRIEWKDSNGVPYTLTGNVHNAEVYKVDLPKVQLFDPSLIPSGSWVYYSQSGNGFGYPGHLLDVAFDGNTTVGSTSLKLQFKSWFQMEKDYDYGYLQICQFRGTPLTFQCDNLESVNDTGEGGPTTGSPADTNPNGTNHGNGMTCSSGASNDPTCGVAAYPEPVFITDEFDLTPYIGQDFVIRWAYSTDPGLAFRGWVIDDIELLKNGTTRIFFDDAEDPIVSNDDTHAYSGWIRSNGAATQEHAYWIGVRDKTGFDSTVGWEPGIELDYANEAHGYGNAGVDDPPAYTIIDSHPSAGSSSANLNDAAWKPFPSSPGVLTANNGDVFTDCDDPAYADGPRHVDNYADPNSGDGNWHFGWRQLKMLVVSMNGLGTFGTMTANVDYITPAPCSNAPPTPTPTPTPKPTPTPTPTPMPGTVQFSSANYNVGEAAGSATITVTRTNGSDGAVSVQYATSNGTATAGQDYTGASGTLNFANGETSQTFAVSVTDDALDEPDETVNLTLSNPTGGATLGTPSAAVLTIVDNDPLPSLSINDVSGNEGNSGTTNFTFTVTLSAASAQSVTVNYATADGTATAASDYQTQSGTLTFTAGETSKSITVLVNGDTAFETNENFSVNLSNANNATIADAQGLGTISNDDSAPTVQLSAASYSFNEGDLFGSITVTRTGDTAGAATVKYTTSDATDVNFQCNPANGSTPVGAASRKCDYHIAVGRLRFAAGETSKQIILSLVNDVYVEPAESLTITLSNPTGDSLGTTSTATINIADNDSAGQANPINGTPFYVRMLYVDLLSREPDPSGFAGWVHRIDHCGEPSEPPPCDRVTVGGDGFLRSAEFFEREFFVIRLYRAGLGRILIYPEVGDLAYVSGFLTAADLELNKQELVAEIMSRPEFSNSYNGLPNDQFVDKLIQTSGAPIPSSQRASWVNSLNSASKTRAQVYREVSERQEVSDKYLHEAQVVSCYYGFFTRNPDGAYFNYLERLDRGEITLGDLANAFINAAEYKQRFGP